MNKNTWLPFTALSIMLAGGSIVLTGCEDNKAGDQQAQQQPKQQVEVYTVTPQPVDIKTILPARTVAYRIAEIRPQVSGTILKREFIEGSVVTEQQSLYLINPSTYQASYNSAKANLASAKASAEVNRLTISRYKSLLGSKAISQQEYDQAIALHEQAVAAVSVAEANLETAQINLAYTRVHSPIEGRIGKSNVTEGALVTANQINTLATVQQLDPIYVDMTQSAAQYMQFKNNTKLVKKESIPAVALFLENGAIYEGAGKLQFSDVTVDETTGSISLRAIFANPKQVLLPGMFIRAEIYEGTLNDSILVPQKSVTRDVRGGASVLLVNEQGIVESRAVVATTAVGSNWLIESGIQTGDKVIINGLQKVRPDQPVEIVASASQPLDSDTRSTGQIENPIEQ